MRLATTKRRYFHGTSAKHLPSIKSKGLLGAPPQRVWEGELEAIPGYVYLTTSPWVAMSYAYDAARGQREDLLLLVVELDRDDPRVMADEDIVPKVYQQIVQQRLHRKSDAERQSLYDLWDLAHGEPEGRKGSREHLADLLKATETFPKTLGDFIDAYGRPQADDPYDLLDDEEERPKLIRNITKRLKETLTEKLKSLGMTSFIDPARALQFATSDIVEELDRAPSESKGNRAKTWMKYRHKWERQWPEWFGPEAGILGGEKPNVAVEAKSVKPDEIWLIPRDTNTRNLKTYRDLPNHGTKVAAQKEPTMTELDQSIQRLAHMKAGALGRVPDTILGALRQTLHDHEPFSQHLDEYVQRYEWLINDAHIAITDHGTLRIEITLGIVKDKDRRTPRAQPRNVAQDIADYLDLPNPDVETVSKRPLRIRLTWEFPFGEISTKL